MHTSYICHRHINKVKRYPVVYFLHGAAGLEISFMLGWHYADALNAGQAMDVILVAPHAYTELSFWMNSRDNSIPLETIIKQELIADVDSKYRTIAERKGRLIEGNSMGGYGAAQLGFKYPEIFGGILIWSGALFKPDTGLEKSILYTKMCGNDLNYWKENSFWNHIEKNHEAIRKMKIHIFIGDKDGLYDSNNKLHNYLNELKIEHSYTVFPGEGHTGVKRYIKSNNFENFKFYKTLLEIPDR